MPTITANLGMQDFFTTTLSAAITDASQLTIYLNSVPTDSEGYLVIDYNDATKREIIFYNVVGANYVTCPADGRGIGTTAQAHDTGADVRMNMVSGYFDGLKAGTGLADSAITTAKIADAAVTPIKAPDLAKAVNRQDNTTNSIVTNQLIQTGWGFILGNGTTSFITEAITFPIAFDGIPIITTSNIGGKDNSDPSNPGELTIKIDMINEVGTSSTTGFSLTMETRAAANTSNVRRYGYSWIAIGTKAR